MNVKVFVEGGGSGKGGASVNSDCRKGFSKFFESAGLKGKMPRIIACGSRNNAYNKFCSEIASAKESDFSILLVDSEAPVETGVAAWRHLKANDNWDKPDNVSDDQAHLMVQAMEAWIVSDRVNLSEYYGDKFNDNALPKPTRNIEEITKDELCDSLKKATNDTRKGKYNKGRHSFDLLASTNPQLVMDASPHARNLIKALDRMTNRRQS